MVRAQPDSWGACTIGSYGFGAFWDLASVLWVLGFGPADPLAVAVILGLHGCCFDAVISSMGKILHFWLNPNNSKLRVVNEHPGKATAELMVLREEL